MPEEQFVRKVGNSTEHGKQRSGETGKGDNSQRNFGELGDSEHGQVVKRIKIVLGLAALAPLLYIQYFGVWKPDFSDHAAKIRVRTAKLPHQIDDLTIVQPEASKVFVSFDVVGEPVDELVENLPQQEHRPSFAALMFDRDDDWYALFPFFEQLGENFRRILQIGHQDDNRIPAGLQNGMHRRSHMAEVACIANYLHVGVGGSDFTENGKCSIAGGIINEDVLIAIFSESGHQRAHALVDLSNIAFFVETWGDDTN